MVDELRYTSYGADRNIIISYNTPGAVGNITGYVTESMAPLATLGPAVGLDLKKVSALLAGALIATFVVRHVRDKMELERRRKADEGGEDIAERDAT